MFKRDQVLLIALKWLDVRCGSGALSEAVINNHEPQNLQLSINLKVL